MANFRVSWVAPAVSDNVTSVIIMIDTGAGFTDFASSLPNVTTHDIVVNVPAGAVVTAQVAFYNLIGRSAPSAASVTHAPSVPAAPTGVVIVPI